MGAARHVVTATPAVIVVPYLAQTDLLLDGNELQINTYTTGMQYGQPARTVARAAGGNFVVVWASGGGGRAGVVDVTAVNRDDVRGGEMPPFTAEFRGST